MYSLIVHPLSRDTLKKVSFFVGEIWKILKDVWSITDA